MLAFVDESGDAGRKVGQGSSRYFVVAVVTFADQEDADACDQRIGLLRRELGQDPRFEFHFSHNSRKTREAFLSAVHPYAYFYHVFALNKDPDKLYGPGFNDKLSLYKWCSKTVFENAQPYLNNATVIIDESGSKDFRNELAVYLRRRIREPDGTRVIRKVKIQRSSGNNLLQLADYVASLSNRALQEKPEAGRLESHYLSTHKVTSRLWP